MQPPATISHRSPAMSGGVNESLMGQQEGYSSVAMGDFGEEVGLLKSPAEDAPNAVHCAAPTPQCRADYLPCHCDCTTRLPPTEAGLPAS